MPLLNLNSFDQAEFESLDTSSEGTSRKPFPCDSTGWTRHTAVIKGVTIKTFTIGGVANDNLAITVGNEQYSGEVLVSLDPASSAPVGTSQANIQKSIVTRNKVLKILDLVVNGKLDTDRLPSTKGQLVEIIAKHNGFTLAADGQYYHKIKLFITGSAKALEPIIDIGLPKKPNVSTDATVVF